MKNVYIYCEGQTEESFINQVLSPYLAGMDIWTYPIICTTKRTATKKYRGGVDTYQKIKKELTMLCRQHRHEAVTTMFDYYAMPDDTPMIDCQVPDIYTRMAIIEDAINRDIGSPNCHFHFSLHEFEGLLFSNPASFRLIADESAVTELQHIRDTAQSPEHINNSPETAPSKRLERLIPTYSKIRDGAILSQDMGIDIIRSSCRHFSAWLDNIKSW